MPPTLAVVKFVMDTIAKIQTRGVSIDFKKLADVQIPRYDYTYLLISNVHKNITSLRNYHSRKNVLHRVI